VNLIYKVIDNRERGSEREQAYLRYVNLDFGFWILVS
jgi:hypothetical protein